MKRVTLNPLAMNRIRLAHINRLMDADPEADSPEGQLLSRLVDRVVEYEDLKYPMEGDKTL